MKAFALSDFDRAPVIMDLPPPGGHACAASRGGSRSRHDSGGSPLPRTASWLRGPRETRSGSGAGFVQNVGGEYSISLHARTTE